MPSQVPSFSSFELPAETETQSSSSKLQKERRRYKEDDSTDERRHRRHDKERYDERERSHRHHHSRVKERRQDSSEARRSFSSSKRGDDEVSRSKHVHQPRLRYEEDLSTGSRSNEHGHPSALSTSRRDTGAEHMHLSDSSSRRSRGQGESPRLSVRPTLSVSEVTSILSDWSEATFDTRADHLSAQYGGPELSQIPKYKRMGKGAVLGLPSDLRMVFHGEGSSQKGVEISRAWQRSSHAFEEDVWLQSRKTPRRRIRSTPVTGTFGGLQEDFVSLKGDRKRKSATSHGGSIGLLHTNPDSGLSSMDEETKSEASTDEEDYEASEASALQGKIKEADRRTRSEPDNPEAWLTLADLQTQLLRNDMDHGTQGQKMSYAAERKARAEVQLSVLDKARRAHPSNNTSISLRLARLNVAITGELWDERRIEEEYRQLLMSDLRKDKKGGVRCASLIWIWARYISWLTGSTSSSLKRICDIYAEALNVFSHNESEDALDFCFALQTRLCKLLERAGYPAKAFAILQCQLELAIAYSTCKEGAFDSIRRHWDSEEQRIGEDTSGAVSTAWVRSSATTVGAMGGNDALDQWVMMQSDLANLRRRPARTDDLPVYSAGEGEVDPYSIILFSEIEPFLIQHSNEDLRPRVTRNIFTYLGLSTSELQVSDSHDIDALPQMRSQRFLSRFWPVSLRQEIESGSCNSTETLGRAESIGGVGETRLKDPWACPLLPFTRPLNSLAFQYSASQQGQLSSEDALFLARVVQQMDSSADSNSNIASSLLVMIAAETRNESMLRNILEKLQKEKIDTPSLLKACIVPMQDVSFFSPQIPKLELVDAVEYYPGQSSPDKSLAILEKAASSGHQFRFDGGMLRSTVAEKLKAGRHYSQIATDAIGHPSSDTIPTIISAAWYKYLVETPDLALSSVLRFFENFIKDSPSELTWQLCQARLRIVWYHLSSQRPLYRPADVRRALVQTVKLFPHDLLCIALLAAHEARFKIEGVVRRTLEEHVLRPLEDENLNGGSLAHLDLEKDCKSRFRDEILAERSWMMAIYVELHLNSHTVNVHLLRTLFERAVRQEITKTSSAIWNLYLSFEVRVAHKVLLEHQKGVSRRAEDNAQRKGPGGQVSKRSQRKILARAKAVFYRAISACPFDRDLYLLAFERPLCLAFSVEELSQVFSVMDDEREVRLYGRVQDLLCEMREGQKPGWEEEDGHEGEEKEDESFVSDHYKIE